MAPPLDPIASLRAALRGHYELEREIGQGAYATVYLARDLKHERKVAVKVLHADPTSEMGELRFIREIRLLARLQHPNILPLHDSGHVEAMLYYVMPYVSGETLRDRIDREKQLPCEAACNIARDVADALAYAHAQGIIHRDIKPENILLSAGHPILADFGIARAIDLAGVRQVTRTGMGSPGTPAYMSPEQLMGDKELDGRSDTYSLGCVLYEMLTGKPPFGGKEGFVKRFTEAPPSVSTTRKDLPGWMDGVVATALARRPNDRYQTAQEFVEALTVGGKARGESRVADDAGSARISPSVAVVSPEIQSDTRRHTWRSLLAPIGSHPRLAIGILVAVVATGIAFGSAGRSPRLFAAFGAGVPLDTARFAVLPFAGSGAVGAQVAANFYDVFTEWQGLPLVPDTRVAQAIKESGAPTTESEAMALGRRLGAGKVVWGTATGNAGSAHVGVHLYDTRTRESKDDFAFDEANSDRGGYSVAANRLLGIPGRPSAAKGCDGGTRSFPAWSACGRGHVALKAWDLAGAEREFRAAIAADADYPTPRLWLAQLVSWQGFNTRGEWRDQTARALAQEASLSPRDRALATALSGLANGQFPEACEAYASLARTSPRDFVALYGLGQCHEMDSLVVASRLSPTGFRFRSSNDAAAKYYMRALRIEPGAHAVLSFDRLQRLLPTATGQIRLGYGVPPERPLYAAYPHLNGDTVGFVPYTPEAFAKLPASEIASRRRALDRDSDLLLDFVLNWSQQAHDDPSAFEALADLLETRGDLSDATGARPSALTAIRRARDLARDPKQRMRVGAREVAIRFKRSEFALARTLADSVLAEVGDSVPRDARLLGGLAALTGKVARATQLTRLSGEYLPASMLLIPPGVAGPAAAFFAHAALGVCGPVIRQLERDLDNEISSSFAEDDRERARARLKARPLTMMAPCSNGEESLQIPAPTDVVLRMQQALARGNYSELRRLLDSAAMGTRTRRPSDLSVDYTYQLAWLRVASGDTASAIARLDIALGALPGLSSGSLRDVVPAAAAIRAMMLRAELAAARNDIPNARRWASAVATLWADADPLLQPVVGRMRSIAGITNKR